MTEVWAVVEREPWESDWTRSLHATKAGAWRAAYALRYAQEVQCREDALRGCDPYPRPAIIIERREVLP